MLTGKGMFTWKIKAVENGDPVAAANKAFEAGLTHVLIKVNDGVWNYNLRPVVNSTGTVLEWHDDIMGPYVQEHQKLGIKVIGWQYIYLSNPAQEAINFATRLKKFNMDGAVLDVEGECKNQPTRTRQYVDEFKRQNLGIPVGFSSYRWPKLHPEISYATWKEITDYALPQVYWMQATNAGAQLRRSYNEYSIMWPDKEYIPTGAAFWQGGWAAKPAETLDFLTVARDELKLPAVNFWEWYFARNIPGMWEVISEFDYGTKPPPPPPPATIPVDQFVIEKVYPGMKDRWGYDGPAPV